MRAHVWIIMVIVAIAAAFMIRTNEMFAFTRTPMGSVSNSVCNALFGHPEPESSMYNADDYHKCLSNIHQHPIYFLDRAKLHLGSAVPGQGASTPHIVATTRGDDREVLHFVSNRGIDIAQAHPRSSPKPTHLFREDGTYTMVNPGPVSNPGLFAKGGKVTVGDASYAATSSTDMHIDTRQRRGGIELRERHASNSEKNAGVQIDANGTLRLYDRGGRASGMLDKSTLKLLRNVVDGNEPLEIASVDVKKEAKVAAHTADVHHTSAVLTVPQLKFKRSGVSHTWDALTAGNALRFSNGRTRKHVSFDKNTHASFAPQKMCTSVSNCFTPEYLKVWRGERPFLALSGGFPNGPWKLQRKS